MRDAGFAILAAIWLTGILGCATFPWPTLHVEEAPVADPEPALVYHPPAEIPVPESLAATSGLFREIPLTWDPVLQPGVAGYVVESAPTREGPFRERAKLIHRGALAWEDVDEPDDPLGDEQTRFYRLRTFGHEGRVSRAASAVVAATTAPLPEPPTELRAFSLQPRSIPLVWRAARGPGVAGYTVERSYSPDGPFDVVAELDGRHATHLLDDGLGDLSVLYYRVSSRNSGGSRGRPTEVMRAVTKPVPLPPLGLRVEGRRLGMVELAWDPNVERDLHAYRLLRWRDEVGPETVTFVGAGETRAVDPEVGAGRVVSYALVAVDRDGLASRDSEQVVTAGVGYDAVATASAGGVRLGWEPRRDEGFVGARISRTAWLGDDRLFTTEGDEILDEEVVSGRRYRYVIELLRADGSAGPASRPLELQVPEPGEPFVEIRLPAPRIPSPEGVPR